MHVLTIRVLCSKELSFFMKGASGGLNGLFINYADYFHAGLYECIAQTTITQTSVATNVIVRGNYQSHNFKVVENVIFKTFIIIVLLYYQYYTM